ncbi:EF-hand [Atractiella rhizophila]|nr:EF-hand [Atractiella rhizophila]
MSLSSLSPGHGSSLGRGRPSSLPAHQQGRHPRTSSQNVFAMFDPGQIQQFKEAFNMMDTDSNASITPSDVQTLLTNMGAPPTQQQLRAYFPDPSVQSINFTQFLSMFGTHLLELDTEEEMDEGSVSGKELRGWLLEYGDRMTEEEVDRLLGPPFTDKKGTFHYKDFVKQLRVYDAEAEEKERLEREKNA